MMKRRYFDLMDDMLIPGRWHLGEVLLPDGSEPRLSAGIRFNPRTDNDASFAGMDSQGHPLLSAEVSHPGRPLDYCITAFNRPIARTSLAHAIATVADSDIQCLPVRVGKQKGFCVLNAVRVVRCIDEDRSEFGKWSEQDQRPDKLGTYKGVTKLRLDPQLIPEDAHFFRLKDWEVALIVSEPVKNAMERAGCLGAKFEEVTGTSELS
jgi:hypothetical protein